MSTATTRPLDRVAQLAATPWRLVPLVLLALLLLLGPWLGMDPFWRRQIVLIAILTLIVSGLNVSFGYAGELALGQVAVYAAGAYVTAYLALKYTADLGVSLLASAVVALVIGLISGVPGLKLGGWSLAICSFFLVMLIPDIVFILKDYTGGYVGLAGVPAPTVFGMPLGADAFYVTTLLLTFGWLVLMRNLLVSRHGRAFQVLSESPVLAQSLGISVYRMKLMAYSVGSIPAGFAGCLFAFFDGYVSTVSFTLHMTIGVVAASIIGGSRSIYGAVVGAALLQLGVIQASAFDRYTEIVYGSILILGGLLFSGGLALMFRSLLSRAAIPIGVPFLTERTWPKATGEVGEGIHSTRGGVLKVRGVEKSFGGNHVLKGVNLTCRPGQITALIGANGSGKTTLLNLVSGYHAVDAGQITLDGEVISGRASHQVARYGIARTFQTPLIPDALTLAEVVATGRYAGTRRTKLGATFRTPRYRRGVREDREETARLLELLGLQESADVPAASLSLGTRRLVEVGRALASQPKLLLLDEPASGLDESEVAELAQVLDKLRTAGVSVLLVDHNFRLVLDIADHICVLGHGEVLAAGTAEEIETHPVVSRDYLGVG